jgi:hypothetical protein
MSQGLRSFQAEVTPIDPIADVSFEKFVSIATDHAREAFSQLSEPEDDLAPFVVIAEKRGLGIVQWKGLDPELYESKLPLVIGSSLAADVSIVGLLLTGILHRRGESGEPSRQEVLLLGVLQGNERDDRAATYAGAIERSETEPPRLSEFELVAEALAPALGAALHASLSAELDTSAPDPRSDRQ